MAKKILLSNGRVWSTQKAALSHFQDMLARYKDEETVEVRVDHDDLLALLERYDGAIVDGPPKIGIGVERFFRRRNVGVGYSTPGFWVERSDESETDFSYIAAVKGQPKSSEQELYDACRNAVAADLLVAKKKHFEVHGDVGGRVPCDLTDEPITFSEAHLDHAYPTFGQLVVSFRAARGWQHGVPEGVLSRPADSQTETTFINTDVVEAFRKFHHGAATLRVLSRTCNLALSSGQRKPKIQRPIDLKAV